MFPRISLEKLVREVDSRASSWNTCAVGETFKLSRNSQSEIEKSLQTRGYTTEQAEKITKLGICFMRQATALRKTYSKIQKLQIHEV